MNLFGVDVRALDVEAFLAAARHAFPLLALAWLVLVVRLRRASVLLAGVLLANAYAWLETNWPLQRLYALGPSSDRVNNIALCQVVAAGHSPIYQPQVGTMHFEPFWAVMTAALSGWDPERLLRIYPLLPLAMAWGFALSLFFALRPLPGGEGKPDDPEPWSGWERALIALSATLLSSAPLDYAAPYRVPWAMTFLLKPNHSLGLVLLPWIVRGFAGIRRGRDRLLVGLLLHLLGWAFVIHMGAFCIGLVTFALMAARWRGDEARRDWLDVAVVIGVNVLVVSPYLFMLFSGYGVFQHGPRLEIPPASPHLLEATARTAALFALAVWGVIVAWRRDRMGRVWAGQAVGAGLLWMSYYALHFLQQAKERDDTYYWLRMNLAVCAAIGAWNLAARLVPRLWPAKVDAPWRAAILTALAIPFTLPYWWDPSRMDLYFSGSLPPLAEVVTSPAAYLRAQDAPRLVLAGDPTAVRWMAALTGARVLIARDFHAAPDHPAREQFNAELARGGAGGPGRGREAVGDHPRRDHAGVPFHLRRVAPRSRRAPVPDARALRGVTHRRLRRGVRAGHEELVITRAGALLGLPPGVPDPVWHIAFWRDLLVVLALAAAAGEARGRRTLALGIATLFAVLAVGFWAAALGRPYGVLSDPGTTRWAADVAVAGWAGGTDGFVVGEPSLAAGWGGLARRLRPDLVLLLPTLLPLLVIPATAALIAALGRRPESTLAAILWVAAGTGTLETLRGLGFLPGLWARPGPALLWVATVAALLAAARARPRAVPVVAALLAAATWIAVGPRGPEVRPADALLALTFDQHILLVAGIIGLRRTRDPAATALVAVGGARVLARALAGIGDAWAGLALYRLGLVVGTAAWLDAFAATLPAPERLGRMSVRVGLVPARLPIAVIVTVTMAGGVLAWWDPPRIDPIAKASLEPIPPALADAMDWMRAHTDPQASVVAPDDYAAAVAVLGGRRVLRAPSLGVPVDDERRLRLERGLFAGQPPAALLQRYGVRYVFLAPGQFREYGIEQPEDLERTGIARTIYANEKGMRLYEIAGQPGKGLQVE